MRIALDTNVLACAEGVNGAIMRDKALQLIQRLPPEAVVLPAQTLGELFNVLVRKAKRRPVKGKNWRRSSGTFRPSLVSCRHWFLVTGFSSRLSHASSMHA